MFRLAFSSLRHHLAGALGAICAAVLATTLVGACGILFESALRQPPGQPRGSSADLVVRAKSTVDIPVVIGGHEKSVRLALATPPRSTGDLVRSAAAVPGVSSAVPMATFDVTVLTGHAAARLGRAWEAPTPVAEGRAPDRPGEVAFDRTLAARLGVSVGAVVRTLETPSDFRVTGLSEGPEQAVYFVPVDVGRLTGSDRWIDLVGVRLADPAAQQAVADRLAGLDGVEVLSGAAKDEALAGSDRGAVEGLVSLISNIGGFALVAAVFVVSSTLGLVFARRHREIAVIRAIGASRRQIRRLVAVQALGISLLAGGVGCVLAAPVAGGIRALFVRFGFTDEGFTLIRGPLPLVIAVTLTVCVVQIASLSAARQASRVRPTDALREASVPDRRIPLLRTVSGLLLLLGGLALAALSPELGGAGGLAASSMVLIVLITALVLLGPAISRPVIAVAGRAVSGLSGAAGLLARANTALRPRLVATAAVPVILAVGLTCGLLFTGATEQHATAKQEEQRTTADLIASRSGGLTPGAVAAIRSAPGVTEATAIHGVSLIAEVTELGERRPLAHGAVALDTGDAGPVLDLGLTEGTLTGLRGAAVAVSTTVAGPNGWHVGDEIRTWTAAGETRPVRIAAVYRHSLGFGDFVLSPDLPESSGTPARAVHLRSSDPRATAEYLSEGDLGMLGLRAQSESDYLAGLPGDRDEARYAGYLIIGLVALYAGLSVANTLVTSTLQRRGELAGLRLLGANGRQVLTMVCGEACVVAVFGMAGGTVAALAGLIATARTLDGSWIPVLPPSQYLTILGVVFGIVLLSALVPAALSLRGRAAEVLRGAD
ncbi:FtsX-like permease family protein [Amycolatopsis pittospori]|uniref:FtsX-like permease family protein n=1 Tax=Amycolatopsis pittospori TaxID=2749434 RepID=UPI0015EFF55C|nr:FtsX-like permease family protein [Amycolatopsis pittospori]